MKRLGEGDPGAGGITESRTPGGLGAVITAMLRPIQFTTGMRISPGLA